MKKYEVMSNEYRFDSACPEPHKSIKILAHEYYSKYGAEMFNRYWLNEIESEIEQGGSPFDGGEATYFDALAECVSFINSHAGPKNKYGVMIYEVSIGEVDEDGDFEIDETVKTLIGRVGREMRMIDEEPLNVEYTYVHA